MRNAGTGDPCRTAVNYSSEPETNFQNYIYIFYSFDVCMVCNACNDEYEIVARTAQWFADNKFRFLEEEEKKKERPCFVW